MRIWHEDLEQEDVEGVFLPAIELKGIPLTTGQHLTGRIDIPLKVSLKYRGDLPKAFFAGPILVVNSSIKDLIQKANTEAEFFQVDLLIKGSTFDTYFFLNIVSEIDCFDREASLFDEFHGHARDIKKLSLNEASLKLDLFRVSMTVPFLFVISDKLSFQIESVGRSVMKFTSPNRYRSCTV